MLRLITKMVMGHTLRGKITTVRLGFIEHVPILRAIASKILHEKRHNPYLQNKIGLDEDNMITILKDLTLKENQVVL